MNVDAVTVPGDEECIFSPTTTLRVSSQERIGKNTTKHEDSLVVVATSESVELPLVVNTAIHVIAAVRRTSVVTMTAPERSGFSRTLRMKLEEPLEGFDGVDDDPIQQCAAWLTFEGIQSLMTHSPSDFCGFICLRFSDANPTEIKQRNNFSCNDQYVSPSDRISLKLSETKL
jgi:hypothetical protein